MTVALAARSQAVADLELAGYRFVASMEGCACAACQAFDRDYDSDILAVDKRERPVIVAWRYQPDWEYFTVTVRQTTDRGSSASQVRKVLDGRSLADVYVQGYRRWVTSAAQADIRVALRHPPLLRCKAHPHTRTEGTEGSGGQTFVTLCADCCANLRTVYRAGQSVTSA
jgi:hypothetical protein